jgi:hypothetical protein
MRLWLSRLQHVPLLIEHCEYIFENVSLNGLRIFEIHNLNLIKQRANILCTCYVFSPFVHWKTFLRILFYVCR